MCQIFDNRGYPVSVVQAGHHHAQQINRQSELQTAEEDNTDRIPFTLTFHPHNHAVKSIILENFKLFQNYSETGFIFSQPPLIFTNFIQTRQKHWQLFGRKFVSNQWPTWNFQMRSLTMQNLSLYS